MEKVKLLVDGVEEVFEGENKKECMIKLNTRVSQIQKEYREKEAKEDYIEKPAIGITGFFCYNIFEKKYFFRVYDSQDKTKFEDYSVNSEEFEVQITDNYISLYDGITKNKIDWSSKVLGKRT